MMYNSDERKKPIAIDSPFVRERSSRENVIATICYAVDAVGMMGESGV